MKKNILWLGILALALAFGMTVVGCDDGSGTDDSKKGSIPAELVGEWAAKADPSVMVFKITSDGTFTSTGQSGGDFDKISVSGNTVEIKYSGTTVAAFDYSISNGEMTITNATGFMATMAMFSPFVKVGSNGGGGDNNGGGIPSALVGEWQSSGMSVFEVTTTGKLIMADNTSYDISVSGNTATLKFGGTTVGTFDYAISNTQMVIFNGTGIGMTIALLSPIGKGGGGIPINPGNNTLSGNIVISPAGTVTVGTQLTAAYSGSETVSFQWKNGTTIVGTNAAYTPLQAGSYTVTVSAAGYTSKTATVTITAATGNVYTVTFHANGGSGTPPAAQTVSPGSSITLPNGSGLYRNGYTFSGWSTNANSTPPGGNVEEVTTFDSWNTNANGTGTFYTAGSNFTPSGNVILYALWAQMAEPIDPGGNDPGGNEPVLTFTSVVAPEASSPTGNLIPYLFLKFNRSAGLSINDITISGVSGVTKSGYLYDQGSGTTYTLGLKTNAKTSGTITVSVTKSGQAVNGSPKTVYVYNNSNYVYP